MAIASIFQSSSPSTKKRPSLEISINKRWSTSTTSVDSPTSRVRQRFSSILHKRKSSIATLDTLDSQHSSSEPRYSSSSDRSSLQQPPTPPPHTPSYHHDTLFQVVEEKHHNPPLNLAHQVRIVLGNTMDDIDEEIDLEWEDHRRQLRQSLQLPKQPISYHDIM
ncbi:hypothetical protein BDA99DRAFT_501248 [Phascolomyces articulosus]|uniref:Uncharacterized protein n=1 Tax=Phascolomyces articulosus TaxID=60185 RepID=A0AAD5PIW4_9FUNG|nr:hypothetical protein BDA99DRAFT_501248 [Phascolomyces articulosus]